MTTTGVLRAPNLGDFLRTRRIGPSTNRPGGLTRQELAARIPCSLSYLSQLEAGQRVGPKPEFVDACAEALSLTATERQHMHNLAAPKVPGPRSRDPLSAARMRELISAHMLDAMHSMAPHLCGYVDERWNVLACNDVYADAYPGLTDTMNVLRWFFTSPVSADVMLEWEPEARLTVAWFRWHMARYQNPAWAMELLTEFGNDSRFAEMWLAEDVEFARPQPLMHLRDPRTGVPYSVNVQITDVPGGLPFQLFVGVKLPFSGPAELLTR